MALVFLVRGGEIGAWSEVGGVVGLEDWSPSEDIRAASKCMRYLDQNTVIEDMAAAYKKDTKPLSLLLPFSEATLMILVHVTSSTSTKCQVCLQPLLCPSFLNSNIYT